jgi:hypothetical protein
MTEDKTDNMDGHTACPVGRFFLRLERTSGRKSKFAEHLSRSHVEFLKALKSLIDEKIEDLEKDVACREKRRATRVNVE